MVIDTDNKSLMVKIKELTTVHIHPATWGQDDRQQRLTWDYLPVPYNKYLYIKVRHINLNIYIHSIQYCNTVL